MKMIKGICIILAYYFLGESLSYLMGGFMPGNIIGMMLLFASLYFKVLNPESVSSVADTLTKNMAIFFIPAGVGLMASFDLISEFLMSILIISTVSTVLVIAIVGIIHQKLEKSKK